MICVDPSHHCAVVDMLKDLSSINRVLFLRFLFRHAAQEIAYCHDGGMIDPSGYDWNKTPPKIDIEPENDGFTSRGVFSSSILIFRGVSTWFQNLYNSFFLTPKTNRRSTFKQAFQQQETHLPIQVLQVLYWLQEGVFCVFFFCVLFWWSHGFSYKKPEAFSMVESTLGSLAGATFRRKESSESSRPRQPWEVEVGWGMHDGCGEPRFKNRWLVGLV